ncbi:3-deoxy-D-manno-octulosonic acid transferase [Desulfovibrio sp. OttesenSCG-928-F07]|nr:3-deoxy-D-manno-octulosonic acid transferase [Desulfovibrio sp. OttesenSCG-928-F07]
MQLAYNLLWKVARPLLKRHKRMGEGFNQRLVPPGWPETLLGPVEDTNTVLPPFRLWIHGASGGEAYLTRELVALLAHEAKELGIVCTSCTKQGVEVLEKVRLDFSSANSRICVNYFPLDELSIMRRALRQIFGPPSSAPRLAVLLETEIWPSLLQACREESVKVVIINGRMTEGSFKAYRHIKSKLRKLAPQHIFATAEPDLHRFKDVFECGEPSRCSLMPNIKFDSIKIKTETKNPLRHLAIDRNVPIITLASVREEEEDELKRLVPDLLANAPQSCVVVAPRHMHRLNAWQTYLKNLNYSLRSQTDVMYRGQVVLWDTFGELQDLYGISSAAFVGGSLKPLGGQNFLEPLSYGIIPCIGPSWSNFYWVGEELFTLGLVKQVRDSSELAAAILQQLSAPQSRRKVQSKLAAYLKTKQGGARMAVNYIKESLWHNPLGT